MHIFMAEVFKKKIWVTKYRTTLSCLIPSSVSHLNNLDTLFECLLWGIHYVPLYLEGAKQKEDIILAHKNDKIYMNLEDQEDGWYSLKWGNEDLSDLGRSWCILLPEYSVSAYVLKTPGRWKVHVGGCYCVSHAYRCSWSWHQGL